MEMTWVQIRARSRGMNQGPVVMGEVVAPGDDWAPISGVGSGVGCRGQTWGFSSFPERRFSTAAVVTQDPASHP